MRLTTKQTAWRALVVVGIAVSLLYFPAGEVEEVRGRKVDKTEFDEDTGTVLAHITLSDGRVVVVPIRRRETLERFLGLPRDGAFTVRRYHRFWADSTPWELGQCERSAGSCTR